MGEMLEYGPMLAEKLVQNRLAVVLIAAPEDVVMRTLEHVDAVDLDESQIGDRRRQFILAHRAGPAAIEAAKGEQVSAGLAVGNENRHG